ncbi:MFS transporter [Parafrankia elaeagni]|uniref:MFS transporter n=1 Tax=Parafrankia elaeagni TaxID=222534 RepID=UPI0003A23EE6|nr:MFS transporter [Parafrankia elaeagni]
MARSVTSEAVPPAADPAARRELSRARTATMVCFFVLALLFASWAPRIPQVKEELGLSDGELGLALLGGPAGALATISVAGLLVGRLGSRAMVRVTLVGYAAAALGLVVVSGVPPLFAVLALWGALACALDVASNAQAAIVEDRFGRRIMMTVHAAWTGGALTGAVLGAGAAALDLSLGLQFLVLGAAAITGALPVTGWMLAGDRPTRPASAVLPADPALPTDAACAPLPVGRPRASPRRLRRGRRRRRLPSLRWAVPLLPLTMITFASYLGEGIAADWSAVYLTDVTGASPGLAGVGLVAYMTCMLGVRLLGDRLVEVHGVRRTIRPLAFAAAVVFALALAAADTPSGTVLGIAGFAVLGAGLACVVPAAFSAAGQRAVRAGAPAGPAIALVSSVGYAGWLAGPPLIGGLAELVGLHATMWTVVGLTCAIAALTGVLAGFAPIGPGPDLPDPPA